MARVRKNDQTYLIGLDVGVFWYGSVMDEWYAQGLGFKYLGHGAAGLMVETFRFVPEDYKKAIEIAEQPEMEKPKEQSAEITALGKKHGLEEPIYDPDAIMPESRL